MHGHVSEARRWLRRALDAAADEPSEARAKALDGAGYLAAEQGDHDEAIPCSRRASPARRRSGRPRPPRSPPLTSVRVRARQTSRARVGRARRARRGGRARPRGGRRLRACGRAEQPRRSDHDAARRPSSDRRTGKRAWSCAAAIGDVSRIALSLCNLGWMALSRARSTARPPSSPRRPRSPPGSATNGKSACAHAGSPGSRTSSSAGRRRTRSRARACARAGARHEEGLRGSRCSASPAPPPPEETSRAGSSTCSRSGALPLAVRNRDPADEARYRAVIESAKAACDPETWERASAEGRAMSLDEAAEYALSPA